MRLAWKWLAIAFLVLGVAIPAGNAWADGTDADAQAATALQRMLVRASGYEDCQFIMYDCKNEKTEYLRYRDESLLGIGGLEEAARSLEDTEVSTASELDGNPLVEITNTRSFPYYDVLLFTNSFGQGTSFMVSDKVALTAAHCVYADGSFPEGLEVQSGHMDGEINNPRESVSKVIICREWADAARGGGVGRVANYSFDYALLVFDETPVGARGDAFACEPYDADESASTMVRNLGYVRSFAEDVPPWEERANLWTSKNSGAVTPTGLGNFLWGGTFEMDLSIVGGMSGGPVFRDGSSGKRVVLGLNSFSSDFPLHLNYACAVSDTVCGLIDWANVKGYLYTAPGWDVDDKPHSPSTGVADSPEAGLVFDVARWAADRDVAPADVPAALAAAREANPDVAAWLCVPGAGVAGPGCRREGDDSYYLTHGPDGAESVLGCAYVEQADAADFSDPVTVLYGHSFGLLPVALTGLHAFADPGFFCAHDRFYVATADGRLLTYRVVEAALYKSLHLGGLVDESDPSSVQAYLDPFADDDPARFAGLRRPEALDASSDRILQLSTCTVPATEEGRWVVTGVLDSEEPLSEAWGGAAA